MRFAIRIVCYSRWPCKPSKPVKYLWLETDDNTKTKIYLQQKTVKYADYKVGMFYVSPQEVIINIGR